MTLRPERGGVDLDALAGADDVGVRGPGEWGRPADGVEGVDSAVVRVLSSFGSGSAVVVEGAVYGKPADGEGPITLPTAPPASSAELGTGLPAPIPVRLVLPFYPGMTVYERRRPARRPAPAAARPGRDPGRRGVRHRAG